MENKQTAVEWLVQEMINNGLLYPISEMSKKIEQSKEMEKQQILIAYDNGWETGSYKPEQYYNETYGK